MAYLEHLNESYGKMEICLVAQNQAAAEEEANGENRFQEDISSHVDIFNAV